MSVYLIHLATPLGSEKHTAQHYLGWTPTPETVQQRLETHQAGNGAKILAAAASEGIEMFVVRIWDFGTRATERNLKNRKRSHALCPICNPKTWQKNAPESKITK